MNDRVKVFLAAILSFWAAGCSAHTGEGAVTATFGDGRCGPDNEQRLRDYDFEASFLGTNRFENTLTVMVFKHSVEITETDGLTIQLDLNQLIKRGLLVVDTDRHIIIRGDDSKPLHLMTSTSAEDAHATLSLFETCPDWPQQHAVSGTVDFDLFVIAEDPQDTGDGERIAGRLSSSLSRSYSDDVVGELDAWFDFNPPPRPLSDPK